HCTSSQPSPAGDGASRPRVGRRRHAVGLAPPNGLPAESAQSGLTYVTGRRVRSQACARSTSPSMRTRSPANRRRSRRGPNDSARSPAGQNEGGAPATTARNRPPPASSRSAYSAPSTRVRRTPSCASSRIRSRRSRSSRPGSKKSSPLLTRRDGDEEPAVVVVRGEEVCAHRLALAGMRPKLELLAEAPHAPLERKLRRVLAVLVSGQIEARHHLTPHQLVFSISRQLENAAPGRQDTTLLVADDEPSVGRRVVVVEQLEQESETAAVAGDGLSGQAFLAVMVDRPLSAVRTDEVRHAREGS